MNRTLSGFFLAFSAMSLLTGLSACSSRTTPPATVEAESSPSREPTLVEPAATESTEEVFQNPVLRDNFPDPFVLQEGDTYYVYATNAVGRNISLASSTDLVEWKVLGNAMPTLPKWAQPKTEYVWAPEVIKMGGQYIMYYTARDRTSDTQCVGVAVSASPEGPFRDTNEKPFVCQSEQGGTIDASPFRDEDGQLYLLYKNDGNCCGMGTYIYVQEMALDGLSLVGEPLRLIRNDREWEAYVIEAPSMFKHEDKYYLFYSANNYGGPEYAVGYAICASPRGPCKKAEENPILGSNLENKDLLVIGPGHQTLLQVGDQTWIIYHVWRALPGGFRGDSRYMWIDRLDWVDGKPVVHGPTTDEQPVPQIP
jgi:beta-xylosidase